MTAEPGEIPGRSAAGFEIVEEFEDASVTKKPIGKRSLAYSVCDRARGHPKSPPGASTALAARPGKRML